MEMKTLNPVRLRELIEKIEIHQIEETGKNRTQCVIIHYRFVGCLQIPEWHRKRKVILECRKDVAVNLSARHGITKEKEQKSCSNNQI